MDTILIGISSTAAPDHKQFWGFYLPQNQTLIRLSEKAPVATILASTSDSLHKVWVKRDSQTGGITSPFYCDGTALYFNVRLDTESGGMQGASYSPNQKLVAYWAFPAGNGPPEDSIFDQVWICPVSNPTKIEHVINFQCLYCAYSFWGIWPEFISDSTLAVSMHHDGDSVSALWEIGLDGHIVRQLTHLAASVAHDDAAPRQPLSVFPNPGRDALTVTLGKPARIHMIDASGREVLSAKLPGGISQVNTSALARGAYIIQTDKEDAKVVLR